jgi:hypothetical protein
VAVVRRRVDDQRHLGARVVADARDDEPNLLPVDVLRREWPRALIRVRNSLLALPTRARQRLDELDHEDVAVLDDVVRARLTELADGAGRDGITR